MSLFFSGLNTAFNFVTGRLHPEVQLGELKTEIIHLTTNVHEWRFAVAGEEEASRYLNARLAVARGHNAVIVGTYQYQCRFCIGPVEYCGFTHLSYILNEPLNRFQYFFYKSTDASASPVRRDQSAARISPELQLNQQQMQRAQQMLFGDAGDEHSVD